MSASVKATAIAAHEHGLCVIPIKTDGTKSPRLSTWTRFQHDLSTLNEIERWFANADEDTGLGLVTGESSGDLELFEFDVGNLVDDFIEQAADAGLAEVVDRILAGYREHTPSGGEHWLYHLDRGGAKTTVLAARPTIGVDGKPRDKPLIETKGNGGFVVIAPSHGSVHPTGLPYRLIAGGFSTIPTLTLTERDALWSLARTYDERPTKLHRVPSTSPSESSRWLIKPGDAFAEQVTWAELLNPHDWEAVREQGEATLWRRPGGYPGGWGASSNFNGSDLLHVWTSAASPLEPDQSYSKFAVYTLFNHGGDFKAAATALAEQGHGQRTPDAAAANQASVVQLVAASEQIPVPAFPVDGLPSVMRIFVEAAAAALRCPVDFVAVPLIVFCGAVAGNSRRLQIKPGFEVLPIFWAGVIGRPGTVKTPALNLSRKLLDVLQDDAWTKYQELLAEWTDTPKDERGSKPLLEHYFATDTTTQAVGYSLMNSRGIVIIHDELAGWVHSFDAFAKAGDRQFWLSAWSGQPIKQNRKTDEHIYAPDPVTGVVGGIQPEVISDLAGESRRDDGFLPRLLLTWPDAPVALWSDDTVPESVTQAMLAVVRQLRRPSGTVIVTPLSAPAKEAWVAWYNENQRAIPTLTGIAAGWAAKAPTHLARIVLVLHMVANPGLHTGTVDLQTLHNGIAILEYFRAHLKRVLPIFGAVAPTSGSGLGQRIERILRAASPDWVSRNELGERLGGHEDRVATDHALDELLSSDVVETRTVTTGGRPRTDWRWRLSSGDTRVQERSHSSGITGKDGIRGSEEDLSRNPVIPYQSSLLETATDEPETGGRVIWKVPE